MLVSSNILWSSHNMAVNFESDTQSLSSLSVTRVGTTLNRASHKNTDIHLAGADIGCLSTRQVCCQTLSFWHISVWITEITLLYVCSLCFILISFLWFYVCFDWFISGKHSTDLGICVQRFCCEKKLHNLQAISFFNWLTSVLKSFYFNFLL